MTRLNVALRDEIARLQETVASLKDEIADITHKFVQAANARDRLLARVTELETRSMQWSQELDEAAINNLSLSETVTKVTAENESMKSLLGEADAKILELETRFGESMVHRQKLKIEASTLKSTVANLEVEVQDFYFMQTEISRLTCRIETQDKILNAIQDMAGVTL